MLTKTRASRRSGDVETPVTVTNPIRGSLSWPTASDKTSRTAAFTLRMRSLIQRHHFPRQHGQLERLSREVPLRAGQQLLSVPVPAAHTREREPRPLPQLVV